jgi:hypothetical protein
MKNVKKTEIMAIVIILFKNEKDLVLKLAKHKNIKQKKKMTEIYIGNKNKLHLRHKKRQIQQLFLINCTCITPVYIFVLVFVSNS